MKAFANGSPFEPSLDEFRAAMRELAGAVSVISCVRTSAAPALPQLRSLPVAGAADPHHQRQPRLVELAGLA